MKKRIYSIETKIQFLLANWPEDRVTYKQLYAYGQLFGLQITSKDIYKAIHGFKHVDLVTTKQMNGTMVISINDDLRKLKFSKEIGLETPRREVIAKIPQFKSMAERKLTQPPPPEIKYTFAVRSIIATIDPSSEFSWKDIRRELEKRNIFSGGNFDQVKPYLNFLFRKNLIERVHKGKPSRYKLGQDFFDYFRVEKYTMIKTFPEFTSHYERNFKEPEVEPAEPDKLAAIEPGYDASALRVAEGPTETEEEKDVLPESMSPADFGFAMFEYMLELRNGKGVEEVKRLRHKLENTQLTVHDLRLDISRQNAAIKKLNDAKQRYEDTIKELTTALNASRNEAALAQNRKKTFSMSEVAVIKGHSREDDKQPSNSVSFNFGT